jgi:hypothetical protein
MIGPKIWGKLCLAPMESLGKKFSYDVLGRKGLGGFRCIQVHHSRIQKSKHSMDTISKEGSIVGIHRAKI